MTLRQALKKRINSDTFLKQHDQQFFLSVGEDVKVAFKMYSVEVIK